MPNYPILTFYITENGLFVASWRTKMGGVVGYLKVYANKSNGDTHAKNAHFLPI